MRFLRDLSIRKKLTLFFGAVCALAAGIGVLGLVMQSRVSQQTVEINQKWLPGVRTLDAMHSQHSVMQRAALSALQCNHETACVASCAERYQTAKRKLNEGFQEYQKLITTQEEKQLLDHLNQLVMAYYDADDKVLALAASSASREQINAAAERSRQTYDAAYELGDEVVATYNKGAGEATQSAIATSREARTLITMSIFLVVAICVAATIFLSNLIARPLVSAAAVLKDVSEKNLTRTFDFDSEDEVGAMAVSLNTTIETMRGILGQIASGADQLAQAAESIAETTRQSSESAQNQSEQTSAVATAMHEMSATVVEVSTNSQKAADAAQLASETAREGGKVAGETLSTMRTIATSNASVGERISQLGKSSERIGAIAAVIDDIADQTNLLALNAAIEAARAGEQEEGFAVVADEVRKLAERTTQATKEIAAMIESIQKDAREAVAAMQSGTREVELGVAKTEGTGKALDQIIQMATEVGDMVSQIATAATEQSATAETVNNNVAVIAEMTQKSSENAGETAKSCTNLSNLAFNLQSLVSDFKLSSSGNQPEHRYGSTVPPRHHGYDSAHIQ